MKLHLTSIVSASAATSIHKAARFRLSSRKACRKPGRTRKLRRNLHVSNFGYPFEALKQPVTEGLIYVHPNHSV